MLSTFRFWGLLSLALLGFGSLLAQDTKERFVVRGSSMQNPEVRAWSNYFDAMHEAETELAKINFDYFNERGLLKTSTDKPVELKVWRVLSNGTIVPIEERPTPPPPNDGASPGGGRPITLPALPFVDSGFKNKNTSLAGKTAYGKIGQRDVSVEFGQGETLVIKAEGIEPTNGKWFVSPADGTVTMTTSNSKYTGRIDGPRMWGTRTYTVNGRPAEDQWSLELKDVSDFVGKWASENGRIEFEIFANGRATMTGQYFANGTAAEATIRGNRIEVTKKATWGEMTGQVAYKWSCELRGNELVGRFTSRTPLGGWQDSGYEFVLRRKD